MSVFKLIFVLSIPNVYLPFKHCHIPEFCKQNPVANHSGFKARFILPANANFDVTNSQPIIWKSWAMKTFPAKTGGRSWRQTSYCIRRKYEPGLSKVSYSFYEHIFFIRVAFDLCIWNFNSKPPFRNLWNIILGYSSWCKWTTVKIQILQGSILGLPRQRNGSTVLYLHIIVLLLLIFYLFICAAFFGHFVF